MDWQLHMEDEACGETLPVFVQEAVFRMMSYRNGVPPKPYSHRGLLAG